MISCKSSYLIKLFDNVYFVKMLPLLTYIKAIKNTIFILSFAKKLMLQ